MEEKLEFLLDLDQTDFSLLIFDHTIFYVVGMKFCADNISWLC